MGVSSIETGSRIAYVKCTIENNTTEQQFDYPQGMTQGNCCLIGAKVYTKYGTYVDYSYDGALTYWGKFRYLSNGKFGFSPTTAGNAEEIVFVFYQMF